MKISTFYFALLGLVMLATSCSSIRVSTDYDTQTDFNTYKTFAFYRSGIDKVKISDLDKRRILRAIASELEAKGMHKSKKPDVLINIFTKAREKVDIYEHNRYHFYYHPFYRNQISKYTEGTLFIDIIDKKAKKLVWQGVGSGFLTKSSKPEKRIKNINRFVREIMRKYPPQKQ